MRESTAESICPKCGGVKNCRFFGCKSSSHYHCDCDIVRIAGTKTNKQRYEERLVEEVLRKKGIIK